jgi:hypothetical protein
MKIPSSESESSETDFEFNSDSELWDSFSFLYRSAIVALDVLASNDTEPLSQQSVNPAYGVRDVYACLSKTPAIFRNMTNFSVEEFEELASLVCPVIALTSRSSGQLKLAGRPPKLHPAQRLLNFLMFLKHDNSCNHDAFQWNWARSSICDDSIFIAKCIVETCANEIRWPSSVEREKLGRSIPQMPGCIGFIDGTLCRIRRPYNDPDERRWFNGRKKMYCFNNTVVVDHNGLLILADPGYPGSFHDVSILRESELDRNWRDYFTYNDNYQEFLLGDPGYLGSVVVLVLILS